MTVIAGSVKVESRDYIVFFVNGKMQRVAGDAAFLPLSDYLRGHLNACGTKVVCAEGDCGACTVMLGRPLDGRADDFEYKTVNSCIQYLFQLDCTSVITVEGMLEDGKLNAVQEAMVECHGAQCGYCTPGFVVALSSLVVECQASSQSVGCDQVKEALTGNLCRCTGYESIMAAAIAASSQKMQSFSDKFPSAPMLSAMSTVRSIPVAISGRLTGTQSVFYKPLTLSAAARLKSDHQGAAIISGGTDICVNMNKRGLTPSCIISLSGIDDLNQLTIADGQLIVGAKVTLRELEQFVEDKIPEFYKILWTFGSPQIRQAGTLAGNIANASPIADTLPFLTVMEAQIEVTGKNGARRIPIGRFYTGYKKMDLSSDEIISLVTIPLPGHETERALKSETTRTLLRLYKVSKREHLDISSVAAAFYVTVTRAETGRQRIALAKVALGGVAATCIRSTVAEIFLQDKSFTLDVFVEAGRIAAADLQPLSDVRGSKEFREQLTRNLFVKFFYESLAELELETDKSYA
ncbi:MAG: FAD binding domain-containing protein [Candidatus Obscuribacterales bacterium]|nr:FAD binding domain-containing protein [Candidatus Obscuribacterales bacterium]